QGYLRATGGVTCRRTFASWSTRPFPGCFPDVPPSYTTGDRDHGRGDRGRDAAGDDTAGFRPVR
ncbi:MAG: hypothetical protein LC772_05225, partial [Chloroflexi bacterium]|nr:hypothetical protein [Chloroflexota bacterium]